MEQPMSESANQPQGAPAAAPAGPQTAPLVVNVQYVKDLSFEVPDAPAIYARLRQAPRVDINLDVQARRLGEGQNTYEVTLSVRADATEPTANGAAGAPAAGARVFLAELSYAGVFTLTGLPENAIEPVLLVECPRLLFPFARNVLAETTREGGFPPVLLQPIDFVALWQARRAQAAAQQPQPTVHA
jgi:preprotein translocase subunit SecB